jgi:hypothetical protein
VIRVFRIRRDPRFPWVVPAKEESPHALVTDGSYLAENWVAPRVELVVESPESQDLLFPNEGALLISDRIRRDPVVGGHLTGANEVLPVRPAKLGLWLVNVTTCVDCLDHELTKLDPHAPLESAGRVRDHAFDPDLFPGNSLFKVPETSKDCIYTLVTGNDDVPVDPSTDPDLHEAEMQTCFKYAYEHSSLGGLRFELVWKDEES